MHIGADRQAKLADLYIEDQTPFLEGVERGVAASERGEVLEEEEMDARVARLLQS